MHQFLIRTNHLCEYCRVYRTNTQFVDNQHLAVWYHQMVQTPKNRRNFLIYYSQLQWMAFFAAIPEYVSYKVVQHYHYYKPLAQEEASPLLTAHC